MLKFLIKNLGCLTLAAVVLTSAGNIVNSYDKMSNSVGDNTAKIAELNMCKTQLSDLLSPALKPITNLHNKQRVIATYHPTPKSKPHQILKAKPRTIAELIAASK